MTQSCRNGNTTDDDDDDAVVVGGGRGEIVLDHGSGFFSLFLIVTFYRLLWLVDAGLLKGVETGTTRWWLLSPQQTIFSAVIAPSSLSHTHTVSRLLACIHPLASVSVIVSLSPTRAHCTEAATRVHWLDCP